MASQFAFGLVAGLVVARHEPHFHAATPALRRARGIEAPGLRRERRRRIAAMNARFSSLIAGLVVLAFARRLPPPGKPTAADIELKPAEVRDFAALYTQQNCAGCHGQDGKGNAALALANPVYLAIASDETIRRATASGIRGFAHARLCEERGRNADGRTNRNSRA
jgi:mono/diheme cytochrome c family protein